MFQKLVQLFLQKFVKNMGRGPQNPAEWMQIQDQAVRHLNKTKGAPSITKNIPGEPKITIDDLLKGPVRSKGPKGDRIWDFSQKRGEVIPFPHKGIRGLMEKGDVQLGKAPKTLPETLKTKKDRGILLRDADEDIARIKRENKEAIDRFRRKMDENEPNKFQYGGIAPLVGEPSYAANFYDDRIPMAGGGALKKFIEKLFIKASNDIRLGRGKWKGLDQKQMAVQHDNLTKKVIEFQKTGKTVGMEEYFGVDPHTAFIAAGTKKIRKGIKKDFPEVKTKKIDKNRKLTEEEWRDYVEDNSDHLSRYEEELTGDETIAQLDDLIAESRAYEADMYQQYKRGDLDKYVKPEVLEEQRLFRQKKIDNVLAKAYDEVFYQKPVTGDYKYDANVLSDSIAEQLGKGAFTDLPQTHQTQIYNTALKRVTQDMQMKKTLKDVEQKIELQMFDPKDRLPNQSGGPVDHDALVQMYLAEGLSYEEAIQAAQASTNLPWDTLKKAEGGREKAEGGRAGYIFGGSAGLRALLKRLRGTKKRIFPSPPQGIKKFMSQADTDYIADLKLQQLETILRASKIDKDALVNLEKARKMNDPGLNFLLKHAEENKLLGLDKQQLSKYTNIDKDIMDIEMMIKNYTEKKLKRKPHNLGGRIGYAGGGKAGLPAITQGTPQPGMQQPQMPGGPQPTGIPGGTIVAQNQMQQAPWMGSQMQQGIGGQRPMMGQRPPMGGMPQRGQPRPGGMPRPMAADGGRIGFGLGGIDKARRAFLKLMAAVGGAGVAAGTGLLKLGKTAKVVPKVTETAEVITRGADGMPSYIYDLIEVVKAKGTRDVIEGFKRSDYSTVHRYKGVDVIEDGVGNIKIKSDRGGVATDSKTGKMHEGIAEEHHMQIERGEWIESTKTKKGVQAPDEYIEGTVRPDMDGKMKDFEEGLDAEVHKQFKEIADEGSFLTQKRTGKASGGLAYALGE